jgi:hypothetical protein
MDRETHQQKADQTQNWDEDEYPPRATLGTVVDGFRSLSLADQQVFLQIVGGMGIPGIQVAAQPAQKVPPAPQTVGENPGTIVPEGYTRDPGTGKIYRIKQAKKRSEEFLKMQDNYDRVRRRIAEIMQEHKLVFDPEDHGTYDQESGEKVLEVPEELTQLVRDSGNWRKEMKSWKAAHPDEFAPEKPRDVVPGGSRGRRGYVPVRGHNGRNARGLDRGRG